MTQVHTWDTRLSYDADGTPPYTDLTGIKNIGGPGISWSSVDETTLQSANKFREFAQGLGDGGEVTFTCYASKTRINTVYGTLAAANGANGNWYFRVEWPLLSGESNRTRWDITGFVTNLSETHEEDNDIMFDVTIKISGKPTFTQGS
jgi:hypothetical protein